MSSIVGKLILLSAVFSASAQAQSVLTDAANTYSSFPTSATSILDSTSGTTYAVGTCRPSLPSFGTISAAVAGVPAGSTIQVCPGNYRENVSVNQPLTLQGITSADGALVAINPTGGGDTAVDVIGTGPVNISNIQMLCSAGCFDAIKYSNASGTLTSISFAGLFNVGVTAVVADGSSQNVTIKNSNFSGIGVAGIQTGVTSGTLAVTLQGNVLSGDAGISVQGGPATISGNYIDGSGRGSGGIASSGGSTISGNTIVNSATGITSSAGDIVTKNKLFDNATAIVAAGVGTFQSNTIMNSTVGIDLGCSASTATSNTVVNTGTGFNNVPTSFGTNKNNFSSVSVVKGTICP